MSINHFSSDFPDALWLTQQHQQQQVLMEPNSSSTPPSKYHKPPQVSQSNTPWLSHPYPPHQAWINSYSYNPQESTAMYPTQNPAFNFNLNQEDDEDLEDQITTSDSNLESPMPRREPEPQQARELEKEPLFEKPLTPSDVGKLNRLVIPKQHAEKYFPLSGDSGDKGLLLSFEDESGKCWRFRYSYWNSSQSYVLTKGWSRYVKEKGLDAGDIVVFERHRYDGDRLFIGWRRRSAAVVQDGSSGGHGTWTRGSYLGQPYPTTTQYHGHGANTSVPYQPDCLHAGSVAQNQAAAAAAPAGNSKRLRLFGVNLECQLDESEPSTPEACSSLSSQGPVFPQQFHAQAYSSNSTNYHNHMDTTFPRDVNQMRNRRG